MADPFWSMTRKGLFIVMLVAIAAFILPVAFTTGGVYPWLAVLGLTCGFAAVLLWPSNNRR